MVVTPINVPMAAVFKSYLTRLQSFGEQLSTDGKLLKSEVLEVLFTPRETMHEI
jgi:hypothetical protein